MTSIAAMEEEFEKLQADFQQLMSAPVKRIRVTTTATPPLTPERKVQLEKWRNSIETKASRIFSACDARYCYLCSTCTDADAFNLYRAHILRLWETRPHTDRWVLCNVIADYYKQHIQPWTQQPWPAAAIEHHMNGYDYWYREVQKRELENQKAPNP